MSLFSNNTKLSQKRKAVGKLFQITGAQTLKVRVAQPDLVTGTVRSARDADFSVNLVSVM